ncbi:MAG: carboxypeptidase-like regulatory domain-containing protein [Planctomycetota bacterium]
MVTLWATLGLMLLVAGDEQGDVLRYAALTEALEHGELGAARDIADRLTGDSIFARKARVLSELAAFLEGGAGPPAPGGGTATAQLGAMRLTLDSEGAFSAALFPESGVGGYRPLLFGWPWTFSSRASIQVDGEAIMLSPHAAPRASGMGVSWTTRERDIEVQLVLRGQAPAGHEAELERKAELQLQLTVINRSGRAREVGARLLLDLVDGFDDAPDVWLGTRLWPGVVQELSGDAVPESLAVGGRAIVLRGVGEPFERVVLTPLAPALASPFDFPLEAGLPLGPDSALALYSETRMLRPGESRTAVCVLRGEEPAFDRGAPIATRTVLESAGEDVWRVLLALESSAKGATGPVRDVKVSLRPSAGLSIVSLPPDLDRLGSLEMGLRVQRAFLVRPDYSTSGPLALTLDVRCGGEADRREKTIVQEIPAPSVRFIAGRIVDAQGRGIAGAEVALVRDGKTVGQRVSGAGGAYRFDGVPPLPHHVLAKKIVHREPAAKAAREDVDGLLYDIVLSSETVDNGGRPALPEVRLGAGRDVVLARSLTRYSVLVVVEWDATREYLEQIVRGMRKAAEFLYVASDGQLTFGRVAVHDAGRNWSSADLWDWANNSVHPNASVSGIRHRFDPVRAPWNTAMNFGRQWAGAWDQIGLYCTVVHEFGHYGLGLYDEYLGSPGGQYRGLSYPEMCRCIMGYQYSDHKICWSANHQGYTNQGMWNGRSCWQQIQEWHQGMRSGVFVPITTPAERSGVTPPDFVGQLQGHRFRVAEEMKAVIRDADTGGFDAELSVAGAFGTALPGVLVYAELKEEGRTTYQGTTWANGRMQLMGVHEGDRIYGLYQGERGELVLDRRRASYVLELGGEPGAELAPSPIVMVRPESAGSRPAGANIEIVPRVPPDGDLSATVMGTSASAVKLERFLVDGRASWLGTLRQDQVGEGRFRIETIVPDAIRGDAMIVSDVVLHDVQANVPADIASFDGSLQVKLSEDALEGPTRFAITSSSGPPVVLEDAVSYGRLHAVLPGAELERFGGPAWAIFHLEEDAPEGLEIRRFEARTGELVTMPAQETGRERELAIEIEAPGVFGLFERR